MTTTDVSRGLVNVSVAGYLARLMWDSRLSGESLHKLRVRKLRRLLVYAYENFEFHRERMRSVEFDPYTCRAVEDLERLPVLDRDAYRRFTTSRLEASPARYRGYFRDSTSGSTGQPLPVIRTWSERAYMLAKFLRVLYRNGYRPGDVMYWVASPAHAQRRDTFLQSLGIMKRYVDSFTISTETMVQHLVDIRPSIIYANKSHLVQMAMYIRQHAIDIEHPRLCISVGETLDPSSLALIRNTFGSAGLIDAYGSLEMSSLAHRRVCEGGPYTFNHDTDIVEVVDDAGRRTTHGAALITDLHIRSFPLIRYRIGDRVEVEYDKGLPRLTHIDGRLDDLIILRDGRTLSAPMIEIVMDGYPEILQYKVIQENYDLLRIVIASERGSDPQRISNSVRQSFAQHVSSDIACECEFVANLPPEANGKLRRLVSKVAGVSTRRPS